MGKICYSKKEKEIVISNVYNTGDVTTTKYEVNDYVIFLNDYKGGIIGYNYSDDSSFKLTINNAYNIGKVSSAILGGSECSNGFTIINSSYLIGQSGRGCGSDSDKIIAKSSTEMQTKEFAESLGDAFVYVEGDYPKLAWEVNGNIEEPTEITSEITSEDTSNIENTTDTSETESISDRPKDIWNGTTDTSWYNSEETEFHISTPEELAGLAELVNSGKSMSGKTFILDNDIYLNDVSDFENWSDTAPENRWTPIGISDTYYFSGIFDEAGFSIEGLYISGSKYQYSGLFGYTSSSSEISNVNMIYEYISNTYSTSKCYTGGITAYSKGKISNCTNNGTVTSSYDSYSYGGGIAGYSTAEISNCTNNGTVTSSSSSHYSSCGGGIAGYSSAEINNCTNSGDITSSSSNYSYGGGIAGSTTSAISDCTNSGTVTSSSSSSSYGGGIAGYIDCSSDAKEIIISNVYNTGMVSAGSYEGGIVGYADSYISSYKLTINNAYNIGKVSSAILGGSKYSDGFTFTIINSSYLIGQSEQGCKGYTDDEIVARSKKEMQTKEFAESLGDAFVYVEGDYPKLAWEVNGNIEEPTEITSETTSEDTSNIENTTDISEIESISTDITESPFESETTTTSSTKATTTATSSYVTTTSTTTTLPVTTMETNTSIIKGTTSTEVTKLSTTITTTTTEPLKAEIDSIEIEVGEKTTIKTNQDNLIFKTSNSDVATVSKMGIITPISAGTAIISVINSDSDSVQIKIKVKDPSIETTEKIAVATTTTNKTTNLPTIKTTSVTTTIAKLTTTVTTKTNIEISVGDVNHDGSIDSKDAVLVLKYYAESLTGSTTTKIALEKGDVNSDGKIDSKDAVKILKYYAQTMVGLKVNIKDV